MAAAHGVEDAVHEFVVNGYAHLPRIISPETVEAMRAAWEPIRDTVVGQQNNAWQTRGQRRFTVNPIVWGSPFIRNGGEVFWEHPAVVEVLERVLGKDYACWGWGCNVPLDGSVHQRWCAGRCHPTPHRHHNHPLTHQPTTNRHRDGGWAESGRAELLAIEWVIHPVTADMGPVEILPGTQWIPDELALPGLGEPLAMRDSIDQILSARPDSGEFDGARPNANPLSPPPECRCFSRAARHQPVGPALSCCERLLRSGGDSGLFGPQRAPSPTGSCTRPTLRARPARISTR